MDAPTPTVLWKDELRPLSEAALLLAFGASSAVFIILVVVVVREYRAGAIATPFDVVLFGVLPAVALALTCIVGTFYLSTGGSAAIDTRRRVLIFIRCPRAGIAIPPYVRRLEASFDSVRWVSYQGPIPMRRGPLRERLTVRAGKDAISHSQVYGTGLREVAAAIAEATGAPLRDGPEPGETRNAVVIVLGLLALAVGLALFALRGQFPPPTPPSQTPTPPSTAPAPAP